MAWYRRWLAMFLLQHPDNKPCIDEGTPLDFDDDEGLWSSGAYKSINSTPTASDAESARHNKSTTASDAVSDAESDANKVESATRHKRKTKGNLGTKLRNDLHIRQCRDVTYPFELRNFGHQEPPLEQARQLMDLIVSSEVFKRYFFSIPAHFSSVVL